MHIPEGFSVTITAAADDGSIALGVERWMVWVPVEQSIAILDAAISQLVEIRAEAAKDMPPVPRVVQLPQRGTGDD